MQSRKPITRETAHLSTGPRKKTPRPVTTLELEALRMVAVEGLGWKEAADRLGLKSVQGVGKRIMYVREKLGASSTHQAIVFAMRQGLIA
jgi:DNA-binding NarL/FixJ family response regulator